MNNYNYVISPEKNLKKLRDRLVEINKFLKMAKTRARISRYFKTDLEKKEITDLYNHIKEAETKANLLITKLNWEAREKNIPLGSKN